MHGQPHIRFIHKSAAEVGWFQLRCRRNWLESWVRNTADHATACHYLRDTQNFTSSSSTTGLLRVELNPVLRRWALYLHTPHMTVFVVTILCFTSHSGLFYGFVFFVCSYRKYYLLLA